MRAQHDNSILPAPANASSGRRYRLPVTLATVVFCCLGLAQTLPYGYGGREPDVSGLIYDRARYYDAETGRFTQRDPLGMAGGSNDYAYADGDPLNKIDRWGTSAEPVLPRPDANACYWDCARSPAGTAAIDYTLIGDAARSPRSAVADLFTSMVKSIIKSPSGPVISPGGQAELMLTMIDEMLIHPQLARENLALPPKLDADSQVNTPAEVVDTLKRDLVPWVAGMKVRRLSSIEERWAATVLKASADIFTRYRVLQPAAVVAAGIRSNGYGEDFNPQADWHTRPLRFEIR